MGVMARKKNRTGRAAATAEARRERVLELRTAGASPYDIAGQLDISHSTAHSDLRALRAQYGVDSDEDLKAVVDRQRADREREREAARKALRAGIRGRNIGPDGISK